ncbi:MAG TPA: hypothetical protein VGT00_18420 [Methylomirabilota bacterium]|nr:hypothetical protein [Methylomirabilota bacterium]
MIAAWRRIGLVIAPLALGVLTACSHTIPLKPTFVSPQGAAQLPVVVGVYYSSEFRQREVKIWRGGDRWDFALGPASVLVLDGAWQHLFEGRLPVSGRPPLPEGGPKMAGVIEPSIEAFDFGLPFLKSGTYTAEITYRIKLHAPDGALLASWTVRGAGAKPGQFGFDFSRGPGDAADLAIQDAATKLAAGFRDVPEVRAWLRQSGVSTRWMPQWLATLLQRLRP